MSARLPRKIVLTSGKAAGGVASYALTLQCGFRALGIETEVIAPREIFKRIDELCNPEILKILSTTAVFAVPLARRTLAIAHGFPCVANQGWLRTLGVLASYRLANASRGVQLVVVSDYSALHLNTIFNLRIDGVIRNPLHPLYEEPASESEERTAITFVGRLHHSKNVHRILPAILDQLDQHDGLEAWIIGDGPGRAQLELMAHNDGRVKFFGALSAIEVRDRLRRSRVFISANPTEPFGIVYLEALSQGCAVVMPASGGGLEIAPEQIGQAIHLFPTSIERGTVGAALAEALKHMPFPVSLKAYTAQAVAEAYLRVDAQFDAQGFSEEAAPCASRLAY
jgi:glycosyltransferase involved in cell wall biosynthesis